MAKILRYWLPVAAWAVLITFFSTDVFHGGSTRGIVRAVLLFFFPDLSAPTVEVVHTVVRELAHMVEYLVLTLLLYRAFRQDASGVQPGPALGSRSSSETHTRTTGSIARL